MIIEKIDPLRECFSDYFLDGDSLTIGGVIIDLATEQDDQEKIITLGKCNGMVHRGLMPRCVYIAEVVIPPRQYGYEEIRGEEDGETKTIVTPVPLDTESVVLRLWPVVDGAESEINHQPMEELNVSE
jgi:hypothetical protein